VSAERLIVFDNVSKFYGEVLGVNRVNLSLPPGVTSLVGPNGSGKTTLMNLLTGLVRPSRGRISVLGMDAEHPEPFFRKVGYCTQFDSFPRGVTGRSFIAGWLSLHGLSRPEVRRLTEEALARVGMTEAADRKVAGYSKGMRQRVRLAPPSATGPRSSSSTSRSTGSTRWPARSRSRSSRAWGTRACTSSSPATSSTRWTGSPTTSCS
jgi:ABC-2 type transport system ATP-binding protein